jgi:LmbE family N-acetylglucosaminyl deacetylase
MCALLAGLPALQLTAPPAAAASAPALLPALRIPGAADRVLIVAPHPDDESLCCAGVIQRTLANGGSVAIVWITSGDAFELDAIVFEHSLRPRVGLEKLGLLRMQEARNAAARLGVPPGNLYFLGYPDRGLRRLLLDRYDSPYRSKYTGADRVPYEGTLAAGSAYTGRNLMRDLNTVVAKFKPTLVFAPSPEDVHQDHRATAELTIRLLTELQLLDRARYWIVHGKAQLPWQRLTLADYELATKLSAIREHRSQLKVMGKKMMSFVRQDELYSLAALEE